MMNIINFSLEFNVNEEKETVLTNFTRRVKAALLTMVLIISVLIANPK